MRKGGEGCGRLQCPKRDEMWLPWERTDITPAPPLLASNFGSRGAEWSAANTRNEAHVNGSRIGGLEMRMVWARVLRPHMPSLEGVEVEYTSRASAYFDTA